MVKVVLLDNIKGLGRVGDVKGVSDGYARNKLFPFKLARPATEGIIRDVESIKAKKLQAASLAHQEAQALAEKLTGARIELSGPANAQGKLFAGIEAEAIAQALSKVAGVHINASMIQLEEHIKTIGEYPVLVTLADNVTVPITVVVSAK